MTHVVYLLFGTLLAVTAIGTCVLAGQIFIFLFKKGNLKYTPIGLIVRFYIGLGVLSTVALLHFFGWLALT